MGKRRIVLYGNSVIIGAFDCSLRQSSRYEVLSLPPSHDEDEMEALAPDVVLFDLEASRPEAAFRMMERHPGLVLIGVGPDINLVKIWSGRQLRELSTSDLLQVIGEELEK
ncbi:MAG: hypothetical protein R6V59_00630 [Dehalococcoidia bacterium]